MRNIIDKYAGLPFEYGADCCAFAAECIESLTGRNPISDLVYANEREAYKIIKQHGGMESAICHYLGEPYDGHQDGDVCLIDANDGRKAAAVIYRDRVVARVENGLVDYPLDRAIKVWKCQAR